MAIRQDIIKVKKNINAIYKRREAAVFAISLKYAGLALNYFRSQQSGNVYWENQTRQAKDRMFSNAFREKNIVGWFLAHGVDYGVYLELANDRQNEAIRPVILRFRDPFFAEVKRLYVG